MHRTHYLEAQKKAGAKVRKEYDQICEMDAQNMVNKVRQGGEVVNKIEVALRLTIYSLLYTIVMGELKVQIQSNWFLHNIGWK